MVTFEKTDHVLRVTIPRNCLPEHNVLLTISVIASLTSINNHVENTDEKLVFNFNKDIPQHVIYSFLKRWGVIVD